MPRKKTKQKAVMGRPVTNIDLDQLRALLRMKPTLEDCAAFFKCSGDTIERRIKEATTSDEFPSGLTFAEFRNQNLVHSRFGLIRDALRRAETSDIMMIFCLKNLAGWKDRQPDEEQRVVVETTVTPNEIQTRVALAIKELENEI